MMKRNQLPGIIILGVLVTLAVFHIFHYAIFCRYKEVPEKSHCSKCRHRGACRKFHK